MNLNVPIPDDLKALLEPPKCIDLSLPKPKIPSLTLPTGASLKGVADISKGIPSECALTFSLLLQVGPILASMDCIFKILGVIGALLDFAKDPINPQKQLKVAEAGDKLAPCLAIPTGTNILLFVRDLLLLIIKVLKCTVQALRSAAELMKGISVKFDLAAAEGNEEMMATLKCMLENADAQASSAMSAIEPIAAILELAGPLLGIAGVGPFEIPTGGAGGDADALLQVVTTLEGVLEILQSAVETLPGGS